MRKKLYPDLNIKKDIRVPNVFFVDDVERLKPGRQLKR